MLDSRSTDGVFDGVSNDEFPISLAVILTVLKRRKSSEGRKQFLYIFSQAKSSFFIII